MRANKNDVSIFKSVSAIKVILVINVTTARLQKLNEMMNQRVEGFEKSCCSQIGENDSKP